MNNDFMMALLALDACNRKPTGSIHLGYKNG